MSTQLYTFEQVAKHNSRRDLWIIIEGKVYDITKFQDEHPGGEEVLLDEGARDATGAFEDVGHSDDARDLLKKYHVGDVDPNSKPVKVAREEEVVHSAPTGNPLRILIPIILIAAYIYYRFL